MSNKWHESDNPSTFVRGATWRTMIWIVVVVLFFTFLGWGLWALGVFTSPIKGQGDAFKQQQSSSNRIVQQAEFEDLYAEYQDALVKIKPARDAVKQNPDSTIKQTELTGLINYCVDVAGDYNAESRKYLAADFKAIDLPAQLDRSACTD